MLQFSQAWTRGNGIEQLDDRKDTTGCGPQIMDGFKRKLITAALEFLTILFPPILKCCKKQLPGFRFRFFNVGCKHFHSHQTISRITPRRSRTSRFVRECPIREDCITDAEELNVPSAA